MSLASLLAIYVRHRMQPSDTGVQALLAACRATSPFTYGPAPGADPMPRPDGYQLRYRREALAVEAKRARNLSQCAKAASLETECRAVTLQILRRDYGQR